MASSDTGMNLITRRRIISKAGDMALGFYVASSPLLGVIAAARAAAAAEPAIIGTQSFVDSTSAKTTPYSFSATVPADCTLVVMLYGIGPVSQAPTGLTAVRLGSLTMTEHPDLAPNSWAVFRPGVGGYHLLNPPTGSQMLVASPEAATHAVSIHLIYLKGFAADPIGAGDNFDNNLAVLSRTSSITTGDANSYIFAMVAVRNNPVGLTLTNGFTRLIGPGNSGGTTSDDHTFIVGYLQKAAAGAQTYGATWSGSIHRAGCGALEVKVSGAALPSADLPFFGQYYGNACFGHNAANSQLRHASELGTSFFFYAERTGVIDQIFWHRRTGPGYSLGDGGKFTIEIRAANPTTKLPLTGVSSICKVDDILPGNPGNTFAHFTTNFTTTGQVIAKQPYCLIWRNTHPNPAGNFFSSNICHHHAFFDNTDPEDYQEPAGADPVNPGSSPTPVAGWTPVRIDAGINWYPWPAKAGNGILAYRRLGPEFTCLRYSDGQWTGWGSFGASSTYRAQIGNGTSNMARERFRVTRANRVVSGAFIRVPRYNATTGNLVVTLESGPASDTSGNGTQIEQVTVPHTAIYDVGAFEDENGEDEGPTDFVPFLWVPFSQNRTLSEGSIYNLRLSATGNLDCRMWCTARSDNQRLGPSPVSLTWAQWEAQRQVPWNCWEDSRGLMVSTNGGSTWSFFIGRLSPILFKCVVS